MWRNLWDLYRTNIFPAGPVYASEANRKCCHAIPNDRTRSGIASKHTILYRIAERKRSFLHCEDIEKRSALQIYMHRVLCKGWERSLKTRILYTISSTALYHHLYNMSHNLTAISGFKKKRFLDVPASKSPFCSSLIVLFFISIFKQSKHL